MTAIDPAATATRWQWHPAVREEWAKERLYFWRLSFPTYKRDELLIGVKEVMDKTGVTAYAVYELYGGYDMLLRVWLPTTQGAFEAMFNARFKDDPNIVLQCFSVTQIVSLWPWATDNGLMRNLDQETLKDRLLPWEVDKINAGLDFSALAEYQERGLVAAAWHSQGIKFIVLIGHSRQPLSQSAEKHALNGLVEILRKADDEVFAEKSLYRGLGFAAYMIIGRVSFDSFHRIQQEITEPINHLIAPDTFGSRTTTFVMSTEDFLDFSEQMQIGDEQPRKQNAQEWLLRDEGQLLEVKGSAFIDLNKWLLSEDPPDEPPFNNVPLDGLMKAIVALLNAEGGTIVIGALEVKRGYGRSPRLEGAPRVGGYLIWGLQPEMQAKGWDWDDFEQKLRDQIGSRIDKDPNTNIDIDRDGVGKRPLCVLTVRAPTRSPTSSRWYYHLTKEDGRYHFWVREGNRTVEKFGQGIEEYQSEKTHRAAD